MGENRIKGPHVLFMILSERKIKDSLLQMKSWLNDIKGRQGVKVVVFLFCFFMHILVPY